MSEQYSTVYMFHNFFIYLSVEGHLGCFYVLAIVNGAARTLGYMCLFQLCSFWGICPVVGLLGHMVVLFLVFQGISILFPIVAVSIYIPTNSARVFVLTFSPAFIVSRFFDDDHSDLCEVIPHCSLDLHLSNNE